jgi:hypothetical protein
MGQLAVFELPRFNEQLNRRMPRFRFDVWRAGRSGCGNAFHIPEDETKEGVLGKYFLGEKRHTL